jgi:hypothetical protein
MNRLPRQPKPSAEQLAAAVAALPRAEVSVGAAPAHAPVEPEPTTVAGRIYDADVMNLSDWLRAATYALTADHNRSRLLVAIEIFGSGAQPVDLDRLGFAAGEVEIDTSEFYDALALTQAVEIATTLQRRPLVAQHFMRIPKQVWEPT